MSTTTPTALDSLLTSQTVVFGADYLSYDTIADYRAAARPVDGIIIKIKSPPAEFQYSYCHDSSGGPVIERIGSFSFTAEVFSNTNPVGIGMNSDGSLPMLGGGCGITFWRLKVGKIYDAEIKAIFTQLSRRYNIRESV